MAPLGESVVAVKLLDLEILVRDYLLSKGIPESIVHTVLVADFPMLDMHLSHAKMSGDNEDYLHRKELSFCFDLLRRVVPVEGIEIPNEPRDRFESLSRRFPF